MTSSPPASRSGTPGATRLSALLGMSLLWALSPKVVAAFTSGSSGAYGPLEVTANTTIAMPPDGVFHCTTITVAPGATLRFTPNPRNTPVRLLATGDVVIAGTIDVSASNGSAVARGIPGPGGFAGGSPGGPDLPPGAGSGPGGGPAMTTDLQTSQGVFGIRPDTAPPDSPLPYGNALLIPLIGGSGGGGRPSAGGGAGGGAVLIASDTAIRIEATGQIWARGSYDGSSAVRSAGSGGAIRLVAPRVVGMRPANAPGSILSVTDGRNSGDHAGRIRIDTEDRSSAGHLDFTFNPMSAATIGSFMTLEPSPAPRLDLVRAAGQDIPDGSGPVYLELPFGTAAGQDIEIQARDFGAVVPVRLRLVPESGPATEYAAEIDNRTQNPAKVTVNVSVPPNTRTAVEVWTGRPAPQ